ncbi:hypothetical protein GQ42DRAFT_50010 [Ramicandelaber brevisporus]|nr:hypothetical protein GQ42DRAFT_50010 [Ramicandelaber brevisporus]
MSDQTYFRLLHLPGELVEYISLFFKVREAHKPLTVSSEFHALFAKRVWWQLDSRVFTLPEPTRSAAIQRYSKLVRYIDFDHKVCSVIKTDINNGVSVYDILSALSSVIKLRISDNYDYLISNSVLFKDIVICYPLLYRLTIKISNKYEHFDLDTLALAIVNRQNNRNMRSLEYLGLMYFIGSIDTRWTRLANFVQKVSCNCLMKIELTPKFTTSALPSQSELQILSKYIVDIPFIANNEDTQFCYATLDRSLFWRPLTDLYSCRYPQLRELSIHTCCRGSNTYDYSEITPTNLPRLQSITIEGHECNNMVSHSYPPAWERVLLQRWSHLIWLVLTVNIVYKQLVTILEHNRQLTNLRINIQSKMLDDNKTFNLATILPLLPKLKGMYIYGNNDTKIDYSPDSDNSSILNPSQLRNIWFSDLVLPFHLFEFVYSLQKLESIGISGCQFYSTGVSEVSGRDNSNNVQNEIDLVVEGEGGEEDAALYIELMSIINTISARYLFNNPSSIKRFNLSIREDDNDWPLDVTLEIITLMPKLQIFHFLGEADDIPTAVKERFPYIEVTCPS